MSCAILQRAVQLVLGSNKRWRSAFIGAPALLSRLLNDIGINLDSYQAFKWLVSVFTIFLTQLAVLGAIFESKINKTTKICIHAGALTILIIILGIAGWFPLHEPCGWKNPCKEPYGDAYSLDGWFSSK